MAAGAKQISNPFSTGGGGVRFEIQVQASFVALLLAKGFAPCLPHQPVREIKVQGRYAGFETDDVIVFTANQDGSEERKLLGQIKHSIAITEGNAVFREVIQAAWRDFNNPKLFTKGRDAIALITGPLTKKDITDTRTILEWARSCLTALEFLGKVQTTRFSSKAKQKKLDAFRVHLDVAKGNAVTDEELFLFLKHFFLIGCDLDIKFGMMHAIVHSLISQHSHENPGAIWAQLVDEVMSANQNAGTISRDTLPDTLLAAFSKRRLPTMPESLSRTLSPRKAQDWNTSEFTSALVVANLLGAWDEKSEADVDIARRLAGGQFDSWQAKIREVLQLPDSPLSLRNGVWTIKQREELWQTLGSRIFDNHLDLFKECSLAVLRERDPQFELDPEQRFAASVHGKVLTHSRHMRKGFAETLALLGSRPEPLVNCSHARPGLIAIFVICNVLDGADWVLWGSLNDLLPSLSEASPNEFLSAVENALSQDQCPFDTLFAQERSALSGNNYLTGLLWALEGIAWDEQFLIRAAVALGALADRDPGGQWANRPSNSLTTIFLPWFPQTTATIEKRKVAIETLRRESAAAAWKLLVSLLPNQRSTSSCSHRPTRRKIIPDDWKDGVSNEEYWEQVSVYAEMVVEIAVADASKLEQLIESMDHLSQATIKKILEHLSSDEIKNKPEEERLGIWTSLTQLITRHRRFADAKWALPDDLVSQIEATADRIAPENPLNLHRRLFCERDLDLYEERDDYQQQERKLEQRRQQAIQEIYNEGGIDAVVRFADSVESPHQVGSSLGSIAEDETDTCIVPDMLEAENTARMRFVAGFVWRRRWHKGWPWADTIITDAWSRSNIGRLLALLPFAAETWERSRRFLGEDESEYWQEVKVNPYQVEGDLLIAVDKLVKHGRSRAAIDCMAKMLRDKQPLDKARAIEALLSALTSSEPLCSHDTVEIIKALQDDPGTDQDGLFKVEWAYLPLLHGYRDASPKLLEHRLASDPAFFCQAISTVYRSRKGQESEREPTEQQKAIAENAYRLLENWRTPPGTLPDGGFSGKALDRWVKSVMESSKESGHLEVSLSQLGSVLIHSPPDPDGLWIHRSAAEVLNRADVEKMRTGFYIAILNSRGAHCVDPTGKPEKELAGRYRQQADAVENAGYQRLAATSRRVAESYENEAERVIGQYRAEEDE